MSAPQSGQDESQEPAAEEADAQRHQFFGRRPTNSTKALCDLSRQPGQKVILCTACQERKADALLSDRLSAASAARKRQVKRETKKVVKRQRRDSAAVAAREQRVSERRANKKREMLAAAAGGNSAGSPTKTETKRIGTRRRVSYSICIL